MKKYKNTGKPIALHLGTEHYDWENGEVVEVSDSFMDDLENHLQKRFEDVTPPPTVKTIGPFGKIKLVPKKEWEERHLHKIESKGEAPLMDEETLPFTKKELEGKAFAELREIGENFGVKFRSKSEGIKEILEAQVG